MNSTCRSGTNEMNNSLGARPPGALRTLPSATLPPGSFSRFWCGRVRALVCGLTASLLLCMPAHAARLAFVAGMDQYRQVKPLRNAAADAQTMAETLRGLGYEVVQIANRDQRGFKDDLRRFVRRVQPGDELVVFYSGHGVQIDGRNYLLPIDVRADEAAQVRDDAVALSDLLGELRRAKPRLTVAIIDACRDNPFESSGKAIGGRGLAGEAPATGELVMFAAGEGQQALDRLGNSDPVRNGVFTRVLVREMQKPGVSVDQVLRNTRKEVVRLARTVGHEQVPALYDQVVGDFYFRPGGPASTQVASVVPEAAPAPPIAPAPAPVVVAQAPSPAQQRQPYEPEMVRIPAGSFMMGSPAGEAGRSSDEGPQRRVNVKAFELGKTEVTQGQWKAVMGSNPSHFSLCGENCPVEQVSWNDAQEYIRKLNQMTGQRYRLPSEAEWEYAARAGCESAFNVGGQCAQKIEASEANFDGNSTYNGSVKGAYREKTTVVGSFKANNWGLSDMHGNVWEWVQDCYEDDYSKGQPGEGSAHRGTDGACSPRVLRGGSWFDDPQSLRSAYRVMDSPAIWATGIGFRLARTVP